jgi:divalent metal cation (Fe/Co/Zn/Cd) transporter
MIRNAINSIDGVVHLKMLRTRSAGMKKYVEARIVVGEKISAKDADAITNAVELKITELLGNVDVIVKAEAQ